MELELTCVKDNDGTLTIYFNEKSHTVPTNHINYDLIYKAVKTKDYECLEELFDVATAIIGDFGDGLEIDGAGQVHYNGEPMHNAITRRLVQYYKKSSKFDSLVLFLQKVMKIQSKNTLDQLFPFIDNVEMPITEDGCFVGYKVVRSDWMDKHTGTIDNSPGKVVKMLRSEVDDNPKNTCSSGLHVANHNYATNFGSHGDRLIAVKVDPEDCVCVPDEYGAEKLRACKYTVLAEIENKFREDEPVFIFDQEDIEEEVSFFDDEEEDLENEDCW